MYKLSFTTNRKISKRFTLIELMVSMAVFTLIMFVLISFFDAAQRSWSLSSAKIETYQNARIALNLITRDLQSAFYEYGKTPFYHVDNTMAPYKYERLCFISQSELASDSATSKISEIQYLVKTEGTAPNDVDWLEVTVTDDTGGMYYNFYGIPAGGAFGNITPASFQPPPHKIIPYVTNLEFICRDSAGNTLSKSSAPANQTFPYSVQINLSLLDKKNWKKWKATGNNDIKTNNERTFTKIVFIGDRGQYQ